MAVTFLTEAVAPLSISINFSSATAPLDETLSRLPRQEPGAERCLRVGASMRSLASLR